MVNLDKNYFLKGMQRFSSNYSNFIITEEKTELFYERLSEYTNEEFKFAVNSYLDNEQFPPTISGIKNKIEELKPTVKDLAREFESMLFTSDTDTLIMYFKRKGDNIAVKVLENNYKNLRECKLCDTNIVKAQLREQYNALLTNFNKKMIIQDNNIKIGINNLANKMKLEN